jgi:magnesium-transporting ATPase (P-type)
MKAIYYIYYRLQQYYKEDDEVDFFDKGRAFVTVVGLIWVNICTIFFFMSSIFFEGINLYNKIFKYNSSINKFILTPILLLPIIITLIILFKKRSKQKFKIFECESSEDRNRKGTFIILYILLTLILFLLSITSPLYL